MTSVSEQVQDQALAPGARVVIRDEEWMVRRVKPTVLSGQAVHVTGTSELVRGKDAIFLTALDQVRELKPEETELVVDDSPRYRRSRLFLESLLRRSPATEPALYIGNRGAMRPTEYQLVPAAKALGQMRPRLLIADAVGLGKTVEVGILLSELIQRGRADRILVVALKSILSQFQKELWARFTIPLVRLDSVGIQRVQTRIPSNMNPFYFYDRVIISIDTLKRDEKYRRYLEECRWDVVVVDECQHVAVRAKGGSTQVSQRSRLANLLAQQSDALILTSATPHDGRSESFASLVNLLEPTAVANPDDYTADEVEDYFIRRFKKDIAHEVAEAFQEREISLVKEEASPAEDAVFERLGKIEFRTIGRERTGKGLLFRTTLLKAFLSSPAACISTVENRLKHPRVAEKEDDEAVHDRAQLEGLLELLKAVSIDDFRKCGRLVGLLQDLGFGAGKDPDRVVVFSERIDTLGFLQKHLTEVFGLKKESIEVFHGSLDDQKQQALVEGFGTEASPIRILLCSDVASEGINLHYHCNRMIHFDLPWSLITLEQRNGRIDRFGQQKTPFISFMLTIPGNAELRGDLRVLERLIEKEDNAFRNLGDVAWLMALHDEEGEAERIGQGIEEGEDPDAVIPDEPQHTDFIDLLLGDGGASGVKPEVRAPVRLFAEDLEYAREALEQVLDKPDAEVVWHEHLSGFTLYPPEDLVRRFDYLPIELRGSDEIKLTTDRGLVERALEAARRDEKTWPEWELFWEQHPVADWLEDRVLASFSRHEAPVLRVSRGLQVGERFVICQGVLSNRRSQPVIVDWFAVKLDGAEVVDVLAAPEVFELTRLRESVANPGGAPAGGVLGDLSSARPAIVARAREHMAALRKTRAAEVGAPLRAGLRNLTRWRDGSLAALGARQKGITARRKIREDELRKISRDRDSIERTYRERREWIEEGMRTNDRAYIRIAAALIHVEE